MRVLIIEDEIHQQILLKNMLQEHFPDIDCMGIAASVTEGLELIESIKPELVFLDVILGPQTSFDLLEKLGERGFDIIFTTSYQEYAVKAFRSAAIDYLLKPVDINELRIAINRVKEVTTGRDFDHIGLLLSNFKEYPSVPPRIALPTLNGFTVVRVDSIIKCQSDNTYTTLYMKGGSSILISRTLKSCESKLKDFSFFRVHNSSLINVNYVESYTKGEGGYVTMIYGKVVNVSRSKKEKFLNFSKFNMIAKLNKLNNYKQTE
jgi:two-component system LytT family response regulator